MTRDEFIKKFKENRNELIEEVCAELLYKKYIRCINGKDDIAETLSIALTLVKNKINSSL